MTPIHIDDWIDAIGTEDNPSVAYAKSFFEMQRWPAYKKMARQSFLSRFKLFVTYKGERYRVIGCSRMGDIWLTKDFNREMGYELRVYVNDCSGWSETP